MTAMRPKGRLAEILKLGRRALAGGGHMLRRSFGRGLYPRRLWFEVTDRCNSRCSHCHVWERKFDTEPLSFEEIERALRDPIFRGLEAIINSGGEPTLRTDMAEILELEHRLFPEASLDFSTNGLLPDRAVALAERMMTKRIPLEIGLSLDGVGDRHDAVRGLKGNFEKVDRLLTELLRIRESSRGLINPAIGFTLSPLTLDSYIEVAAYARKRGVPLAVQWYNNTSFYENDPVLTKTTPAQTKRMIEIVQALPRSLLNDRWIGRLQGGSIAFPCFAMHLFCILKANGEIVPCLTHWTTVAGNIREKSPSEIWRCLDARAARDVVGRCEGCLNSWGVGWSALYAVYPNWKHYLMNPDVMKEKLRRFPPGGGKPPR